MRSNNLYNTLPKERLIGHGCNQWPKSSNWCFVIEEGGMKSELGTLMNIIRLRGGAALYNECVHATRSLGGNFPKQNSKFLLIVFFFIDAIFYRLIWYIPYFTQLWYSHCYVKPPKLLHWLDFFASKTISGYHEKHLEKNIGLLLNFVAKY